MRIVTKIILLMLIGIITHPGAGLSDDIDIGQIIEKSSDGRFIQVHNRIYHVDTVEVLAVIDEPQPSSIDILSEGDIVKVVKGQKQNGYWQADLVTIYTGELAKTKRKEMELPDSQITTNEPQSSKKPEGSNAVIYENGTWHN